MTKNIQTQHPGQGRRGRNRPRNKTERTVNSNTMPAMLAGNKSLTGEPITRFPVALRNHKNRDRVVVVNNAGDLLPLLSDGQRWECLGQMPYDINRQVLEADAPVQFDLKRTYGVYRILSVNGNTVNLFPTGKIVVTSNWLERNRAAAGGYVLRVCEGNGSRNRRDLYMAMGEKAFNTNYAPHMDPETLEEFQRQYREILELLEEQRQAEAAERRAVEKMRAEARRDAELALAAEADLGEVPVEEPVRASDHYDLEEVQEEDEVNVVSAAPAEDAGPDNVVTESEPALNIDGWKPVE